MKCLSPISSLEIHSFSFNPIDSRMYVVLPDKSEDFSSAEALIVDPCNSKEAEALLAERGVRNIVVVLTHEHYDHISGVNRMRELFPCTVVAHEKCAQAISDPGNNLSKYFSVLFITRSPEERQVIQELDIQHYTTTADEIFSFSRVIDFFGHEVLLRSIPGHSPGSIAVSIDGVCLFSGDSLLRTPVVLRKPLGNKAVYMGEALPYLLSFDDGTIVYPGHGECGTLCEMDLIG